MHGYDEAAELLRALSHPIRLQILELLARDGEACVCHLECSLGQRQAYISQNLSRLRQAGLVVDRREGLNVYYSLADEALLPLLQAIQNTTTRLARASGGPVHFTFGAKGRKGKCPCPRCAPAAKPALA